jgi:hypothetical protein
MKPSDELLLDLASRHLGLETLVERRSDSLDFHTVSVWGVRAALSEDYCLGVEAGRRRTP